VGDIGRMILRLMAWYQHHSPAALAADRVPNTDHLSCHPCRQADLWWTVVKLVVKYIVPKWLQRNFRVIKLNAMFKTSHIQECDGIVYMQYPI